MSRTQAPGARSIAHVSWPVLTLVIWATANLGQRFMSFRSRLTFAVAGGEHSDLC